MLRIIHLYKQKKTSYQKIKTTFAAALAVAKLCIAQSKKLNKNVFNLLWFKDINELTYLFGTNNENILLNCICHVN